MSLECFCDFPAEKSVFIVFLIKNILCNGKTAEMCYLYAKDIKNE